LTTNQTLDYFRDTAIPQADLMISTATKQYNEGDINYLDFQQIYAQAIGIRETHLQEQLKQKLLETNIQFITGK
jgi:cobalt-zinc-cadmium resistance protein CzcA